MDVIVEAQALREGEELRASLQELLRSELGALDELRRRLLEGTVRLF